MKTEETSYYDSSKAVVFAITSLIICFFLAYIDEGYYDFRWMKNIGNWIAITIYVSVLFTLQLVCYHVFFRKLKRRGKTSLSVLGGCVLLALLLYAIYG